MPGLAGHLEIGMGRATELEHLLSELCTQLGFCGAIRDVDRFRQLEAKGADAFTDAVLEAENLDPQLEKQLRREVHKRVSKYFGVVRQLPSASRGVADSAAGRRVASPESTLTYAEPRFYRRSEAATAFCSPDDRVVCDALVGVAFHEPDWRWVQSQCELLASHPSSAVRGLVVTCFGHLARIHGQIDRDVVDPILETLAADPDPGVAARVQDALDDFDIVLRSPTDTRGPSGTGT